MSKPSNDAEAADRLEKAAQKAKEVAADIRQAADDLAVANTVLDAELAEAARTREIEQALDHTDRVEKTLDKSAEALEEVNNTLDSVAQPTAKR